MKKSTHGKIDGIVQERRNSSVLAMELRLSCTNSSKCFMTCKRTHDSSKHIDLIGIFMSYTIFVLTILIAYVRRHKRWLRLGVLLFMEWAQLYVKLYYLIPRTPAHPPLTIPTFSLSENCNMIYPSKIYLELNFRTSLFVHQFFMSYFLKWYFQDPTKSAIIFRTGAPIFRDWLMCARLIEEQSI